MSEPISESPESMVDEPSCYVVIHGERFGPFTRAQVEEKHRSGALSLETPVWQEGMFDWQRLDQFLGISIPSYRADPPRPKSRVAVYVGLGLLAGIVLILVVLLVLPKARIAQPPLPVQVWFRPALFDPSMVASIQNQSERVLSLETSAIAADDSRRQWQLVLQAGEVREIGWLEGWRFLTGERLELKHPDYRTLTVSVP